MTVEKLMPKWLLIAFSYSGLEEIPGPTSNLKIIAMAKRLGGWIASYFKDDDIPWCALFVNNCLAESGFKGTGSLAARSFETWGVRLSSPSLGAVLVFTRPGGGGHVGFYVGERTDGKFYRVYGGNQKNAVNETWISKERLLDIRWPREEPLLTTGPIQVAADGTPISTNEG